MSEPRSGTPFEVRLDIDATRQELTAVVDRRKLRPICAETIQEDWTPHDHKENAAHRERIDGPSMSDGFLFCLVAAVDVFGEHVLASARVQTPSRCVGSSHKCECSDV